MIYFILAESLDAVKIGFTKKNPLMRMSELQTGCPVALTLLHFGQGGFLQEQHFHKAFKQHNLHGEWFRYSAIAHLILAIDPRRFHATCKVCSRQRPVTQEEWESRTQEPISFTCNRHGKIQSVNEQYDRSIRV
jgi:hypothetical protein